MASKFVRSLLSACTLVLVGATLFVGLVASVKAADYNGNYLYDSNGNKAGCASVSPPYDCNWSL